MHHLTPSVIREITGGEVFVNGEQQDEPYINGDYTPGEVPETVVPEVVCCVMLLSARGGAVLPVSE